VVAGSGNTGRAAQESKKRKECHDRRLDEILYKKKAKQKKKVTSGQSKKTETRRWAGHKKNQKGPISADQCSLARKRGEMDRNKKKKKGKWGEMVSMKIKKRKKNMGQKKV